MTELERQLSAALTKLQNDFKTLSAKLHERIDQISDDLNEYGGGKQNDMHLRIVNAITEQRQQEDQPISPCLNCRHGAFRLEVHTETKAEGYGHARTHKKIEKTVDRFTCLLRVGDTEPRFCTHQEPIQRPA